MIELNAKGEAALAAKLAEHGRNTDYLAGWINQVEDALNNRSEGESLSVELGGLRNKYGGTVFFEPSADEITTTED